MISKFSKMHNSLFTKIVLSVTALSFMSLFGVSGYINSANSNKAVIKVDDIEISQSEFNYLLQTELTKMKAALGDVYDENDDKKREIAAGLAKIKLDDALIENTMKKYNIDFSAGLIRDIILVTPQFQSNGQFDREAYNWYLRRSGQDEAGLIQEIKRNLARKILLDSQVAYVNVPQAAQKQMEKILGQRRTFNYIKIATADSKIDREPTTEELDQYYEDLSEEFAVPEKRDVTLMYLSMDNIEQNIVLAQDEIDAYYKEHIEEFEQPEQREVQQIVFETEEKAVEARKQLDYGVDFMQLAQQNGQSADDTNFGFVSRSDLADDLSDVVFNLHRGQVSQPINLEGTWQLLKVTNIKPASKTPKAEADAKIAAELKQEKAYDGSYDLMSSIEDKLGSGASLNEISQDYHAQLLTVKALDEEGNSDSRNLNIDALLQNQDVRDAAFSYNEGETSQAIEVDDGLLVVQVDKIIESHIQPREEVADKIKKLWLESERASVAQETVDNIEYDLEAGDSLADVAHRYGFFVRKTMPITRGETFDILNYNDMKTLFALPKGEQKVLKIGDDYIVAATSNIYDDAASLSTDDKEFLAQALYAESLREMSDALLKGYAKDYKVEVNYNRMGLND